MEARAQNVISLNSSWVNVTQDPSNGSYAGFSSGGIPGLQPIIIELLDMMESHFN